MTKTRQNGWQEVKIGDFADVKHGYAFKGQYITDEVNNNILVTPGNFYIGGGFKSSKFKYFTGEIPQDYVLKEDDIIVTMTDLSKEGDTLGYSAKVPKSKAGEKYLHNQRIGLLHFESEDADKNFIYWLMRTRDYHWSIVGSASGTSIRHTSPTTIKQYKFLLPPLPEQKAIAEMLSSLDEKIDLLHRQNKTLEDMAQALFRKWFVEEAKEDWEEVKLGDYFPVVTGKKDANYSSVDGQYPFFTCAQGILKAPDYSFEGSAILLAGNGDFNVKRYIGKFEAYQRTYVLIPHEEKYFGFLYTLIKYHLDSITGGAQGSVISFITKGMITDFQFSIPKINFDEKLEKFNEFYTKIDANQSQINTLENLRDTLLPRLISGAIKVRFN